MQLGDPCAALPTLGLESSWTWNSIYSCSLVVSGWFSPSPIQTRHLYHGYSGRFVHWCPSRLPVDPVLREWVSQSFRWTRHASNFITVCASVIVVYDHCMSWILCDICGRNWLEFHAVITLDDEVKATSTPVEIYSLTMTAFRSNWFGSINFWYLRSNVTDCVSICRNLLHRWANYYSSPWAKKKKHFFYITTLKKFLLESLLHTFIYHVSLDIVIPKSI